MTPVSQPWPPVSPPGRPVYLAGLLLAGRRVVVVGGGPVALRRARGLLDAQAQVVVVAPSIVPGLHDLADGGRLTWLARPYRSGDLDGAWYAVTATGDPDVDTAVAAEAERGRLFCVRADRSRAGTALTPATGSVHDLQVGVLTTGPDADPRRAAAARDRAVAALTAPVDRAAHGDLGDHDDHGDLGDHGDHGGGRAG